MRIMIIGAGSLGLLFAAKLSAFCEHMTVIARTREQATELAQQGIALDGTEERYLTTRSGVIEFGYFIEEVKMTNNSLHHFDYIFLMVKQPAITQELVDYLKTHMSTDTYLVSFQNGIGHEEMLGGEFGRDRLLLAVTTEGAKREGLTAVSHTGHGVTYMGTAEHIDQFANSAQILLVELLEKAGFQIMMSNNMEVRIWSKLMINAVINPLTAILRVKNGELLVSPWTRSLMRALYQEACIVAEAKGVLLPDELWDSLLGVCEATSMNHSSMLQDIEQSRHTEIDRINGSLLQMAKELNLELPTHETIYQLVKALE
ncbi:2-dehydropantoate 2-reductase [Paenibacillus sp. yr247]|uniref:ketopantoate reductase family protein n=1 Tax=Paenibacillus sp. yr247 TaxID=1761880 RepID=UPI0008906400|nr:2-dehydropantoate 2-reductase [Paenibacillus sp. yr247]SDM90030.1 2-dehydropantoate 2-reductase [Paenibacillus sp. yr247]